MFIILGISVYLVVIFDINNYKSELEDIISKKSNTEFRISGDLEIDLGSNTVVTAELLSVRKNDILILESDIFTADVSLSQVLQGKFDINSVSLIDSKLYGVNVDETIIQTYSLLSGKRYSIRQFYYKSESVCDNPHQSLYWFNPNKEMHTNSEYD